jgi:hypothetical protein
MMHSKQTIEAISKSIQGAALRCPPGDIRSAIERLAVAVAEELSGGDEVSIVIGKFIPPREVEDYYEDGDNPDCHVYFDADGPKVKSIPKRVLVCQGEPYLTLLDAQLGGSWWKLQPEYDLWVEAAAKAVDHA